MSHEGNQIWLGSASENFEDAKLTHNWSLAMAVIADVREQGFSIEADSLQVELNKAMMDPV